MKMIGERNHHSALAGFGVDPRHDLADIASTRFGGNGIKNRIEIPAAFGGLLR